MSKWSRPSLLALLTFTAVFTGRADGAGAPATVDPGIWTLVDSMSVAQRDHPAVLLGDGKVLVLGDYTRAAELYDPVSQTFAATGSTQVAHGQGASATRLRDGRVLVVGGWSSPRVVELYEPESGIFSVTDSSSAPRTLHTATLLSDGRVLVAGGQDPSGPQTHAVVELYDPDMGTFTPTDSLIDDRSGHAAVLLPTEEVLIVGGAQTTTPGIGICLDTAELYDPVSGTFRQAGALPKERCSGTRAALLHTGKVLVVGGNFDRSALLYDPISDTFGPADSSLVAHGTPTLTVLQTGHVLAAGGSQPGPVTLDAAEIYIPSTDEFVMVAPMNIPRQEHAATLLADGTVLVTGGYSFGDRRSAEVYQPSATTPVTLLYLEVERSGTAATLMWGTGVSSGAVGFHVYRQERGAGRQRLTTSMLAGRTDYQFVDPDTPKEGAAYWLAAIGRNGDRTWYGPAVLPPASLPGRLVMAPPTPNPFRRSTRVSYSLPRAGHVRLDVHDIAGRRVATLVDQEEGPGEHTLTWTGAVAHGTASSGIYFLHLDAGGVTRTQKVMFVP